MSKNFITGIFLLVLILAILWTMDPQDKVIDSDFVTIEESREIAINWIENNSPTYLHDGENLSLLEEEKIIENQTFRFTFSFESRSAGYGNRSDELTAQVITPHKMEVIVDRGEVILAITDSLFSETENLILEEPYEFEKIEENNDNEEIEENFENDLELEI